MADNTQSTENVDAPRQSSIFRSSALMASGTLVSRLLGFLRAALLAASIGAVAGGVSGAFQTANTMPNMVFNLLAAGVFDAVLVPQIVRAFKRAEGDVYVNRLITLAGTILFVVTIVAMVAAPLLVFMTSAGYDEQTRSLAIAFALVCLPQIFFYGLYNLLGELLHARGVFGPYMWAPVVNNIVGIAGLGIFLVMWGSQPTLLRIDSFSNTQFWVLAGSATLGVITQALVLLIPMKKAHIRLKLDFHFRGTSFGSASRVAGWTFATLAVSQIGVLSTTNLASQAEAWAKEFDQTIVGLLAYNTVFMIFMVPQSLIALSLATALFTRLAHAVSIGDEKSVAENYYTGVRSISVLSLLAAAILMAGSVPVMQMVLPKVTDAQLITDHAWILWALMPGVASTGMVLMSQRVFFAYEDARPVFLMGIVPTILQVIVAWTFFFTVPAQWWVAGAALSETACRILQGIIAIVWVSRRNTYVNRHLLLISYAKASLAALISFAVGFALISAIGAHSLATSTLGRLAGATGRMILVAVVTSLIFVVVMAFIDPVETARTVEMISHRVPLPAGVQAFFAKQATKHKPADEGILSDTGDLGVSMDQDDNLDNMHRDNDAPRDDTAHDDSLSEKAADELSAYGFAPLPGAFGPDSRAFGPEPPVVTPDTSPFAPQPEPSEVELESSGGEAAASGPELESSDAEPETLSAMAAQMTGKTPEGEPFAGNVPNFPPPSEDDLFPQPTAKTDTKNNRQSSYVNSTVVTVTFFVVLTLVASMWAVRTAFAPLEGETGFSVEYADDMAAGQSDGAMSGDAQSAQSAEEAPPTPVVAPVITSATVLSWQNDDGDRPNEAINMIDGNPETEWHSRYYDLPLPDDNNVAIVLKFEQVSTLQEITLNMDPSTSGGELVVRNANPDNPRAGSVLATTAMGPVTTITLPEPVTTDSVTLAFRTMPTSYEGRAWPWISEITVR
ncbi:MAG: hypothetical protein CSA82_00060 [Actinobacteria bacterium]|nr:MAG: hypothetical protein CSA82_00060 [Actinomycetota bacterium]